MTVLASHLPTRRSSPAARRLSAIYIRLTKEDSIKTGLSFDAQERACREYAARAGLGDIEIFLEKDAVGGNTPFEKRPAGRRLIEAIKEGRISNVIVRDIDRLARDLSVWIEFTALLVAKEVALHTITGPFLIDSAADEFSSNVRASVAQFERKQTGDRVRHSKREMARKGRHTGGPPPFGFTSQARHFKKLIAAGMLSDEASIRAQERYPIRGHLYEDESEASIVRLMFDLYLAGWGFRRIGNELDARGLHRRSGKPWHSDKIRRCVNNPVVAGFITDDEVHFESRGRRHTPRAEQHLNPGRHKAIISEADWRQAQKIKKSNTSEHLGRGNSAPANRKYVLAGVITCPLCGSPLSGKSTGARKGGTLICPRRKYFGANSVQGCAFSQLNEAPITEAFWRELSSALASPQLVDQVYEATVRQAKRASLERRQALVEDRDAAQVRQQLDVASRRHADAEPDSAEEADAAALVSRLKRRLREIRERTATTTPAEAPAPSPVDRERIATYLASLHDLMRAAPDEAKMLVRSLVEHHGLRVSMLDTKRLRISLCLRPPTGDGAPATAGGTEDFTVNIERDATLPSDRITAWHEEQRKNPALCACGCGKPTEVRRRHIWTGLPLFRSECRHRGMSKLRWSLARQADAVNGEDVARLLSIGRTTVNRWIAAGKLPKPTRSVSRMLLFPRAAIDELVRQRQASPSSQKQS